MNLLAYIDPGSGLLVWQLLVAGAMAVLFYLKRTRKFLGRIGRKIIGKDNVNPPNPANER